MIGQPPREFRPVLDVLRGVLHQNTREGPHVVGQQRLHLLQLVFAKRGFFALRVRRAGGVAMARGRIPPRGLFEEKRALVRIRDSRRHNSAELVEGGGGAHGALHNDRAERADIGAEPFLHPGEKFRGHRLRPRRIGRFGPLGAGRRRIVGTLPIGVDFVLARVFVGPGAERAKALLVVRPEARHDLVIGARHQHFVSLGEGHDAFRHVDAVADSVRPPV